jgi:hypothetical protein
VLVTDVISITRDWRLVVDPATAQPYYQHRDGRVRTSFDLARAPEAPVVYRAVKREFDVATALSTRQLRTGRWERPGRELRFRAMQKAVFGLEFALKLVNRWDESLKAPVAEGVKAA